jgi:hypothetical protein
MNDLTTDDSRMELPETGIYVRAKNSAGTWSSFDLAHLDKASVRRFVSSRDKTWAENVVLILLGHAP